VLRGDLGSVFFYLLAAGCALLPFSTSPEDGGVVAYGLPFLILAAGAALPMALGNLERLDGGAVFTATAFIALILITTLFAPSVLQSSVRAFTNVVGYLLYLGCLSLLATARYSTEDIARIVLRSCLILALYFIGNFLYASAVHGLGAVVVERYVGGLMSLPWGASNTIGQVLLLAFVAYAMLPSKTRLDVLSIALVALAVLLTFSRSVGVLMVLMALAVLQLRSIVFFFALALCGVAALFVSGLVAYSDLEVIVLDRINPEGLATAGGRFAPMYEKIQYFLEHPLAPIGYYASLSMFDFSAHNYWITTLVEQSILGVLVSLAFFIFAAVGALNIAPRVAVAFGVVMLGLLVEDPHFTQPYIVLFWVLLALLVSGGRCLQAAVRLGPA
jgi:hypothetical protein